MGFLDVFRNRMRSKKFTDFRELGSYSSVFRPVRADIFASETIRETIRPIAEHTSKANARCSRKKIENMLNYRPNRYMNGKDFLAKVRNKLELNNTVFVWIMRDDTGAPFSVYPVPYSSFEAVESNNMLFIRFKFNNGEEPIIVAWDDLVALRKDYNKSDIAGDDNTPIYDSLNLLDTTDQGISNAVKSTANLRGIIKSTKAMLSDEDVKKQRDRFVRDYLSLENEGGIASLDSTQEFMPITMSPMVTSWEQRKQYKDEIHNYYGVSEAIIKSDYTEAQMNAFYDSRIEPFLVALSIELTSKIFTDRERAQGAFIMYESNRLQFASMQTKLALVQLVDRGALTPNEWRMVLGFAPIDGGDQPIRRLDTAEVNDNSTEGEEDGTEE